MVYRITFILILVPALLFSKNSLWKVQGKTNQIYLMGSVHLLSKESYPLDEAIYKAFDDSPNLIFEMDLDSSATPAAQKFILSMAMFKNGLNLKQQLSADGFLLADSLCKLVGMDVNRLLLFKPWMVATTVMMVKMQKMGLDPQYGIDRHLFGKGKQAGKKITGLETLKEQIGFIDNLDMAVQEKMLVQMAAEFNTIETYMDEIVKAWASGNSGVLEEVLLESYKQEPELHDILLIQRNKNWMQKILPLLDASQNYMIIVGAGHLVGEQGLIDLLRKAGFSVEQM
jgi:uncharacterized protein YbaP (TraB family)